MCGINGGWTDGGIGVEMVRASLEAIRHRGPDESGTYLDNGVFLGNTRLSIIDLEDGQQPLRNEDGSLVVTFNGEVYNYLELMALLKANGHVFATKSDTEVLVHLYEEYGVRMCEHLRGMFAFAIWDSRKRLLFVARDRFGKKPLYYRQLRTGGLVFASELKALLPLVSAAGEQCPISEQAVYDYLTLSIVPQPFTIFENVFSLPPGSAMIFEGQKLEIHHYWQPDYEPKARLSYEETLEGVRRLVGEAVRFRLRSDVPLGIFLSGGVDSSVITYEASKEIGESLTTFTVAMQDRALDESPVAQRTAKFLKVRNVVLPLRLDPVKDLTRLVVQYDQPYADSSAIPSYKVSRLARDHVKVVLNGDGGDELLAGYRRHLASLYAQKMQWIPDAVARTCSQMLEAFASSRRTGLGFAARFLRGLKLPAPERFVVWTTDLLLEKEKQKLWMGVPIRSTESWIQSVLPLGLSLVSTQLSGDIQIGLLSDMLVKMDIATMAASVEARSPFMDHVLAEFCFRIPDHYLFTGRRTKSVLRDAYKAFLPNEVTSGSKRGFEIPLSHWLDNDLRSLLMDTLGNACSMCGSYLERSFIKSLLERKTMKTRNQACMIYSLLVLELWLRGMKSWSK